MFPQGTLYLGPRTWINIKNPVFNYLKRLAVYRNHFYVFLIYLFSLHIYKELSS